jgi:ABC-type transport system involved in multi-copper enzyme maturation permease subunit
MSMGNVTESIRPIESPWGRGATGVLAVARYEILRSLTLWRISLWLAMILFPVALVAMVSYNVYRDGREPPEPGLIFTMILFVLIPEVVTVLGMLLWATPIVSSELEGQTWIYSLVRPGGRRSVLLGKYLVAVLWTASCGILAVSLAIPWTGIKNPTETWLVLVTLCGLSSIAHGALFSLLGVLFQRRVMVIAFVYAILVEAVLGWIPAVINKFTAAYHLRSLLIQWLDFPITEPIRSSQLLSDGTPAWVHVTCLLGGAAVLLTVSCWRISRCQYTWQSDV